MLKKDQALAAMDAHIIRVEAERKLRLERRTRRLTRLYPALKSAPLEQRESLVLVASKESLRRWPLYALAILVLGSLVAGFLIPDGKMSSTFVITIGVVAMVLELILGVIFYLGMRGSIKRMVADRFRNGEEKGCATGA
jgi:hypothetical protein